MTENLIKFNKLTEAIIVIEKFGGWLKIMDFFIIRINLNSFD